MEDGRCENVIFHLRAVPGLEDEAVHGADAVAEVEGPGLLHGGHEVVYQSSDTI